MILAHTVKGWTIDSLMGKNATHQMKKLGVEDAKRFRDRLGIPITDQSIEETYAATGKFPLFHPGADSPEMQYMMERRNSLGGSLPKRVTRAEPLELPGDKVYDGLTKGNSHKVATTMAAVRLLKDWMRDPNIGARLVPIAPDEYRTFGMDAMFPSAKIYDPHGQQFEGVDREMLLQYKMSTGGQMLHEASPRPARWPRPPLRVRPTPPTACR